MTQMKGTVVLDGLTASEMETIFGFGEGCSREFQLATAQPAPAFTPSGWRFDGVRLTYGSPQGLCDVAQLMQRLGRGGSGMTAA